MKRFFLSFATLALWAVGMTAAVNIPFTTLTYDVIYHWGLINKVAGTGYVNYHTSGNAFYGQLQGHSIPWDGRIYTVDTSLSAILTPRADGVSSETVTGLQGVYSKPQVGTNGASAAYKNIYGQGTLNASPQTMEAVSVMSNMLGIFYYAKELNFDSMAPGQAITVPIMRGGVEEPLYLTYEGRSEFSYAGYTAGAYKIVFQYTYDGAPDRYPVTCLIEEGTRIPLQFTADLLIGHVEMCYVR